jgi:hypothetical protein
MICFYSPPHPSLLEPLELSMQFGQKHESSIVSQSLCTLGEDLKTALWKSDL